MTARSTESETDVLIVGGGPVGLALAGELGWRGVDCVLVEQTDGAILTPKMNEVNIRTMEHCRRWGIADRVMDCPFPADYPMDVVFVTNLGGHELARIPRPAKRDQRPGDHSPMNLQICSQMWFDPILRDFAQGFPTVTLRHRCRFEGFSEDAGGVTAALTDRDSGGTSLVHARHIVACDGANSPLREARGIGLEGSGVLGRPVHCFFRAPGLLDALGRAAGTFFLALDRDGLWANIRIIDPANALWRLMILDTPEGLAPEDIDIAAHIRRAIGRDFPVEVTGVSIWVRKGVVAERYRDGPVFLAGDSAHQLSPTGALGMNTGIGDAVDLGWKLAAMRDGWGGDRLLDSYDPERRAVGARNVAMTTEFHHDHESFGGVADIEDDTPEAAEKRARLGPSLVEAVGRMFRTDGLQIGYRYDESPICVADGSDAPPDDPASYAPTARPGARAPHGWLADGRSTLDLFGTGFVLMDFGADDGGPAALRQSAAARGVPLEIVVIADRPIADLYERALVLVRSDGHVAWRGDTPPQDTVALIDFVRGA